MTQAQLLKIYYASGTATQNNLGGNKNKENKNQK